MSKYVTGLLLVIILLLAGIDLVFALDSIPAVMGISRSTLVIYTSNIFAVLGLRSLFFLLKGAVGKTDSKLYSEQELDIIAGGGVAIFKADQEGFPLYMRHQLTTDVSSLEVQEESIGTVLDLVQMLARKRLSKYLGNRNIDDLLVNEIATISDGMKRFLIDEVGAVQDFKIITIARNPLRKDGIILEVQVTPFYPLNEIKFYIFFCPESIRINHRKFN